MEHGSEVTTEANSDHGAEKDGQSFDESERCPTCKCRRENESEEMQRLRLENRRLKEELQRVNSRGHPNACPSQASSCLDSIDGMPGEGSSEQKEGAGEIKGSSEMNRKNDSSQMKDLLCPDSSNPGCREGHLINLEDENPSTPSTSGAVSDRKREGPDPGGPAGRCDDSEFGENCPLWKLNRLPDCHMQLERLSFGPDHTVLVDVYRFQQDKSLVVKKGRHMWDNLSVRMPYAEDNTLSKHLWEESRWGTIKKYLSRLAKASPLTSAEIEKAVKKYNPKYKDQWSFDALHRFFEAIDIEEKKIHVQTLRRMADLAVILPDKCPASIPLLRQRQNRSITLSQMQIACLLANAFYCTFPHRNATHPRAEYANFPTINFHSLFGRWAEWKKEKFRAIFHYFKVVTGEDSQVPRGLVTFSRQYIPETELIRWKSCSETLTKLHVSSGGTIEEDGQGMLQVDFACSMVGGGVLASGLVQEEILFLINPELIVARLFTEKLGDTECLKITGSQQYSEYSGYSGSFTWRGPHKDTTERDEWMRRHRQIVAIDALNLKHPREQFSMKNVTRELNKAYCGFRGERDTHPDYYPAIATGNWGCGAFGGDAQLKALIQMMAAAVAKRDLAYFTFRDSHLQLELQRMHGFLTKHKVTVGRLYKTLENYCEALYRSDMKPPDLYTFIRTSIKQTTSRH